MMLHESVVHLLLWLVELDVFESTGNAIRTACPELLWKFHYALVIVPWVFRPL